MKLILDHVSRDFRGQVAIDDVSMTVESGEVIGILGANGAGKTTLLKLIAGVVPAASGRIALDDALIKPNRINTRRQVRLLDTPVSGQFSCVKPLLRSIADYQVDRSTLASEVADWFVRFNLVGVYGKKANELSKGQLYKLELISLFDTRPSVWLLDEPFSNGLDANGLSLMISEIREHASQGGIVLFSNQWPEQAKQVVSRFQVLNHGKLVWDDPAAEVPGQDFLTQAEDSLKAVYMAMRNNA